MKMLVKMTCAIALVALIAGCNSKTAYVPHIPPEAQANLLDYYKQPDNKVFILAVDPGGDYAFAYDYGKDTIKEAAKVAVEKVDAQREVNGIMSRPYVYAINDRVVWSEMIHAAHQTSVDKEREAQAAEFEKMKAEGEVEEASAAEVAEQKAAAE